MTPGEIARQLAHHAIFDDDVAEALAAALAARAEADAEVARLAEALEAIRDYRIAADEWPINAFERLRSIARGALP